MAEFRVSVEPPVQIEAHGHASCTLAGRGARARCCRQLLQHARRATTCDAMGHNSPEYLHTLIEAVKLAFADREAYYGDPRFVEVPIEELISKEYAARRTADLRAIELGRGMPPPGDPCNTGRREALGLADQRSHRRAATARRHHLGLRASTARQCILAPRRATCSIDIAHHPGHRPVSVFARHAIVGRSDASVARSRQASAAPDAEPRAGDAQGRASSCRSARRAATCRCKAMLQVFLNIVVFGMDPQVAVEAPRFASLQSSRIRSSRTPTTRDASI